MINLNLKIMRFIYILFIFIISFNKAFALDLLHASYDPTRELYMDINKEFLKHLDRKNINIKQSHSGSSKQARAIIDGLEADIFSAASPYDIDMLVEKQLVKSNWQESFMYNSCPSKSTIVFLVRKNNPKNILDWSDLIKENISIVTPNPKTSGGAKWNYIAAWTYGFKSNQSEIEAREFVTKLYRNTKILDTAARAATINFVKKNMGDVLIAWENEAYLAIDQFGSDEFEIIIPPSHNIEIFLPVTIIDKYADKHKTHSIAKEYLEFLYSQEAQEIFIKHNFRPTNINFDQSKKFSHVKNFDSIHLEDDFYHKHFDNRGIFDQIYKDR